MKKQYIIYYDKVINGKREWLSTTIYASNKKATKPYAELVKMEGGKNINVRLYK